MFFMQSVVVRGCTQTKIANDTSGNTQKSLPRAGYEL